MTVNNPEQHNAMPADGRLLAMRQLSSRTDQTGVLAAGDRVVAVRSGRRLLLCDPGGSLRATVPIPKARGGLAGGPDAVWVADPARGRLLRVDPGF